MMIDGSATDARSGMVEWRLVPNWGGPPQLSTLGLERLDPAEVLKIMSRYATEPYRPA
jgi:hypothetical protein